jgi:nucleoside-diphosphate-sugar epimerase
MNILITGGIGFIATKLIANLLKEKKAVVAGKWHDINQIHALDIVEPSDKIKGITYHKHSLSDAELTASLVAEIKPDVVIHLAAVVSSAAEADFDLGLEVNLDGTRYLLAACRNLDSTPLFIFASSVAVFSGVKCVTDSTTPTPSSTYGMTKVVGEYLVNEYSRRGFVHGISVRLPTVAVRPGKPNLAASSFVSSIIREPLNGEKAICPVDNALSLWISSPKTIVKNLLHAISLDLVKTPVHQTINLPGISVTVKEMIASLSDCHGDTTLIEWQENSQIKKIVSQWPEKMLTDKALQLEFYQDISISDIVNQYIEEENVVTNKSELA